MRPLKNVQLLVSILLCVCVVVWFTLSALLPHRPIAAAEAMSVPEILERVQKRYKTAGFEADFVQESHLQAMGIVDAAEGHVYLRPPAKMRWHYKIPEDYLIITDGKTLWIYRPAENQVMSGPAAGSLGESTGLEYFTDPASLQKDFVVEVAPEQSQQKGQYVLRLVPKTKRSDLAELLLFVSKKTFDIVQSITCNAFGDKTSIRFSNFEFDRSPDLSLFEFEIPKGADVVPLGSR